MKRAVIALLAALLLSLLAVPVSALEPEQTAESIFNYNILDDYFGFHKADPLYDGNTVFPIPFVSNASVSLSREGGIGSLYLIFSKEYGVFSVTDLDNGEVRSFGENCFLHEYADLETAFGYAPERIKVTFVSGSGHINEMLAFTPGSPPDYVQIWEKPKDGEADIVLFSTHCDDEQLFFAGLLPYYAAEMGYEVEVVYLTNHRNMTLERCHEALNGLWAVGVTNYPVFGPYSDLMSHSADMARYYFRNQGVTEEELLGFVVENLRRFRPMVAVGHDLQGEYGHGQHMLYADLLTKAVEISMDPGQYPESAEKYGVWDVPKTYLHLYPENEIYMDWDQPLSSFDGMTAFQVTQKLGFPCHITQYWDFAWYITYAQSAASITQYNPGEYGLYRSTVGMDTEKNDFFENVMTHAQRKAEEAEAARLAAEEEARLREEQRQEELRRAEEARKEEEERLRQEQLRAEQDRQRLQLQQEAADREQTRRRSLMIWGFAGTLTVLLLLGVVIVRLDRKNKF